MKHYGFNLLMAVAILCAASPRPMAQTLSYTTADVFNGRMWLLLSDSQKAVHLTGIQEGIKLCLNQIREDLQISPELMQAINDSGMFDRRRLLFTSQGISAIEAGLNNFYQDPANLHIPIIAAYQHVTLMLNFAPSQELADNLSNLRRKYKSD